MADPTRQELEFGGLFNSLGESKTPFNRAWGMLNCSVDRGILEARPGYALFGARTSPHANDIGWGLGYGRYSGDETQTIRLTSGTITGGTWSITWNGQTASGLAWDIDAEGLQSALEGLSNLLIGDILVEGNGWTQDDRFRITFKGQYANTNVAQVTVTTNLLTGTGSIVITPETEINGGLSEEYVAVVQLNGEADAKLYSVNATTGVYTQVLTGLHASDWLFTQYGNTIYGVNAHQGMISKIIGSTAGLSSARPTAPAFAPDATTQSGTSFISITGLTMSGQVGWGSNPTPTILGSGTVILALNANVAAGTTLTIDFTWAANQDFSLNDPWSFVITATKPVNLDLQQHLNTVIKFLDNAATVIEPTEYGTDVVGALGRWIHWQGEERAQRKITRKIRITFRVDVALTSGVDSISIQPVRGKQWPNDSTPIDVDDDPTQALIDYAHSYRDLAGGLESDLSPVKSQPSLPATTAKAGANVLLEGDVSLQLTNTDLLYFYRREKATGTMRRLPNIDGTFGVLNTGTPQFTDTYLESELAGFPGFGAGQTGLGPEQLAGSAVAICTWKQTLTVGGKKQAWESWIGQPTHFEPSPDEVGADFAPEDELSAGRTDYVSDDRSEEVLGLHGQDPLYAITEFSAYAMVGDSPAEAANFRRLPGSRGTVGVRSSYPLGGGFDSASQDMLSYYSVGRTFQGDDNGAMVEREETAEVRKSWKDLAVASGCVVIEHLDEIWVFQGTKHLRNTRTRKWVFGEFPDSVKAANSNRVRGFKFLDSRGRLFAISESYTTDAGTTIPWWYESGWLDIDRQQLKKMALLGSGAVTIKVYQYDGGNTLTSPLTFVRPSGKVHVPNFSVQPALRYKFRIEGASAAVTVESAAIWLEKAPGGWNN